MLHFCDSSGPCPRKRWTLLEPKEAGIASNPRAKRPGEYSDWQTERLRDRLMAYYCARAKKHGVAGWHHVASDTFRHEDITCYMDVSQVDPVHAFGESLRRFSRRQQTPDDDRLYVLSQFLERAGFLTPIDLDQASSPHHAAYGLSDHYGLDEEELAEIAAPLQGLFMACEALPHGFRVTSWRIEAGVRPGLITAKEHNAVYGGRLGANWPDTAPDIHRRRPLTEHFSDGWMTIAGPDSYTLYLRDRDTELDTQYFLVGMSTGPGTPALIAQRYDGLLETDFLDCQRRDRDRLMADKTHPPLRTKLKVFWKQEGQST